MKIQFVIWGEGYIMEGGATPKVKLLCFVWPMTCGPPGEEWRSLPRQLRRHSHVAASLDWVTVSVLKRLARASL